jgi:hypothetical protein
MFTHGAAALIADGSAVLRTTTCGRAPEYAIHGRPKWNSPPVFALVTVLFAIKNPYVCELDVAAAVRNPPGLFLRTSALIVS